MESDNSLQPPWARPTEATTLGTLQAIRRIASSTNADPEPARVLQTLVDAISEQTRWQVCWVSAVDVARGSLFVVARSDRLEYTKDSRKVDWSLAGSPALAAMRADEPIVIPDVQASDEFPEYQADARARGYRSGVVTALNGETDQNGRPLVLYLQAKDEVHPDPAHLVALRHIADIGSVAIRNSRRLAEQNHVVAQASRSMEAATAVIDAVLRETPDHAIYELIQRTSSRSFAVADASPALLYCGPSPRPDAVSDADWRALLQSTLPAVLREAHPPVGGGQLDPTTVRVPIGDTSVSAEVIKIGANDRTLGSIVVIVPDDHARAAEESPLAVQILTSMIATTMMRGYLEYRAGSELRSDLLGRLFAGEWTRREELLARAGHVGLPVDRSIALVAIEADGDSTVLTSDQRMRAFAAEVASWPGALLVRAGDGLALMVPVTERREKRLTAWLNNLKTVIEARVGGTVLMSLGGRCDQLEDYPQAWRRCRLGIQVARKLRRSELVSPDDFGVHRLLLAATDTQDLDDFIQGAMGRILLYDEEHGTDLFETLEQFALTGGRFQETARNLQIHVSTLRYRLSRIEELYGRPIDMEARFEAALAARLYRFIEGRH